MPFYDRELDFSTKSEKVSVIVYSLIETAKVTGLDPEQYLQYLFEQLPNTANFKGPGEVQR